MRFAFINRGHYEKELEELGFSSVSEEIYLEAFDYISLFEDPPNIERKLTINGEERRILVQFTCENNWDDESMPYLVRYEGCRVY